MAAKINKYDMPFMKMGAEASKKFSQQQNPNPIKKSNDKGNSKKK